MNHLKAITPLRTYSLNTNTIKNSREATLHVWRASAPPSMFVRHYYRPHQKSDGTYGYSETESVSYTTTSGRQKNATYLIYAIIAVNVLVFLYWQVEDHVKLYRNFICSRLNMRRGRYWTLVTSIFSHKDPIHLFLNMYGLYSLGQTMAYFLGPQRFMLLYLTCGVVGSLAHLQWSKMNRRDNGSIGASGAVLGVLACFCLLSPSSTIILLFIPVPAIGALALTVAYDLYSLLYNPNSHVGHIAHLGGMAVGAAYWAFFLRRIRI